MARQASPDGLMTATSTPWKLGSQRVGSAPGTCAPQAPRVSTKVLISTFAIWRPRLRPHSADPCPHLRLFIFSHHSNHGNVAGAARLAPAARVLALGRRSGLPRRHGRRGLKAAPDRREASGVWLRPWPPRNSPHSVVAAHPARRRGIPCGCQHALALLGAGTWAGPRLSVRNPEESDYFKAQSVPLHLQGR